MQGKDEVALCRVGERERGGRGLSRLEIGLCDFEMRLKGWLRDCSSNDTIRHKSNRIQICSENMRSGSS